MWNLSSHWGCVRINVYMSTERVKKLETTTNPAAAAQSQLDSSFL